MTSVAPNKHSFSRYAIGVFSGGRAGALNLWIVVNRSVGDDLERVKGRLSDQINGRWNHIQPPFTPFLVGR